MLNLKSTRRSFMSRLGFMAGTVTGRDVERAQSFRARRHYPQRRLRRSVVFGSTG
jgi:hypothetical protein